MNDPQRIQDRINQVNILKQYQTPVFQLRDIPMVMRTRLGWPVSAKLMERWFNGNSYKMNPLMKKSREPYRLSQLPSIYLDENIIKMKWALGFERVNVAMENLKKKWNSPNGIERLEEMIKKQGMHQKNIPSRFGDLSKAAKILHETCQTNYWLIGKYGDPMDDFYGAMGESQLNIAVSGMVTPQERGKFSIEIDELGFYLRDCYDFNDENSPFEDRIGASQPLGCWGFTGVSCLTGWRFSINTNTELANISPETAKNRKYLVANSHFQKWRMENGKGGDFMILSDVHRIRLPRPIKISW
nr:hypothetical protein H9T68_14935 [Delftia sp. PS-11]